MKRIAQAFALAAMVAGGCSSNDGDSGKVDVDLSPPPMGQGLQLQMVSDLAAGVETERCRFFVVPAEGYAINREEIKFTAGSHHVLLYSTPYKMVPNKDRFGNPVDTSGVFECGVHGPTAHWDVDGVVGGSQTASGPPGVQDLPQDTALKVPGGTILLMNTHYLNATDKTLHTDARINLFTIPADKVKQEAGVMFFYNPFIRVAPNGQAEAREVCPVTEDISLVNVQSHMHRRGVDFLANLLDENGQVMTEVYKGKEWQEVVVRRNTPPLQLKKGQALDYRCGYDNKENRVVTQGLSTKDEMCMLLGLYYPRNRQFELCGLNKDWSGAFMGARWIGSGTMDGVATASCFMTAKPAREDGGDSFYGCVVNSCPKISTEASNAARCLATHGFGKCGEECKDESSEACKACVGPACMKDMAALAPAKCE